MTPKAIEILKFMKERVNTNGPFFTKLEIKSRFGEVTKEINELICNSKVRERSGMNYILLEVI